MMKRLEDMTLEELWELFPITLSPHNPAWAAWAAEEIELLNRLLSDFNPVISHIGSTAIPLIHAKPIIDILIELNADVDRAAVKDLLCSHGYICMAESSVRMSFNKGYTVKGYAEHVFHIHVHPAGDRDEILFRDYLLSHPELAKEYEKLKLSLLPAYRHNRDGYTDAKTQFVKRVVALCKDSV